MLVLDFFGKLFLTSAYPYNDAIEKFCKFVGRIFGFVAEMAGNDIELSYASMRLLLIPYGVGWKTYIDCGPRKFSFQ